MNHNGRSWKRAATRLVVGGLLGALFLVLAFAPSAMAAPVSHFSINNATLTEGNAGTSNLTFTISYTGTKNNISVDWATANGTATAGTDYVASSGTATFTLAGAVSQTITVPVMGDVMDEPNETFTVNLSNPQPPATADISVATGTGTITDNDAAPSLSIDDVSLTEGNAGTSNADFTVSLSAASGWTVTVNYTTANGTAVQPGDYTTTSGTLTFTPGQVVKTISVPIVGDTTDENDEGYVVNLSAATRASISDNQGAGTIVNDDTAPSISIDDPSLTEGNSGTANITFTVSLSAASGKTITVAYATADGTGVAGTDYNAAAGTVTFTAGQTSRPVTVAVRGDTLDEIDETFAVNLSTPTNATIADSQGVGTIVDNDAAPALTVNNVTVTELDAGTVTATFTVTASAPSGKTMLVDYGTGDVTATAGADYTATSGTLTFTPGQTTNTFTITVLSDVLDEANETYAVPLSNAVNATTISTGTGTITDNDPTPGLVINDVSLTEGDAGTVTAAYTVTLSAPSGRTVTVNYATANGTAFQPGDYTSTSGTLTFTPGTTTQPLNVPVLGDLLNEANETYVVNLSGAVSATITDSQGAGTIVNDDPLPTLAINDVTLTEGDAGTTPAAFTVTLSAPSGRNVTVNYATANGTAAQPGDYTSTSGTLTFLAGTTTMPVNVPVVGDLLNEVDETFVVNLTTPGNATIADAQGTGTIVNNDPVPTLAIDDVSLTEGNSGTTSLVFTVSLSAASGKTVTVLATTAPGTAVAPSDYTTTSTTVTFTPGQTTRPFTVPVVGDLVVEPDETFVVNLSGATNATIADAQGTGTIVNNDVPPAISIADASLTEGDAGTTNLTFTLSLSAATGSAVTIAAATANDTAVAPGDYTATAGTVTFAVGQTSRTFVVPVRGDLLDEFDETFFVNLSGAANATIADTQAIGTIVDNDPAPTVSVSDVAVSEGDVGSSNATFTLTLSAASGKTVSVDAATADDTAAQPADYAATSSTVTFNPGQTTRTFVVPVNGDTTDEIDETYFVNLSNPANVTIAGGQGLGTITDDDPLASLSIGDVTVVEGDAGTTTASFAVTLAPDSGKTVTVDYGASDATATSPADFAAAAGTLTFNPGQTSKTVNVAVNGDLIDELDETFLIDLTNPGNATIAGAQATGTITDDDAAPTIAIDDVSVTEGDAGTTVASFDVTLSAPSGLVVTVDVATSDGTATHPADFAAAASTLTFNPGQTSKTVDVTVNADTLDEFDETFDVDLSGATNSTLADGLGIGTILDDDPAPTVSVSDVAVSEGDVGSSNATFTLTLSAASGKTVTVDYATSDGSATQPADYAAASGTVTFNPGQTSKVVDVTVNGDLTYELDETFGITLSNPTHAVPAVMNATGTIQDDDPQPTISVDDRSITEGDAGTTTTTFTVSLSNPSAFPVTLDAATVNDTATTPADYAAAGVSLTFAPGQVSTTVDVDVKGDILYEGNERFELHLTNAAGASVADGTGIGTIQDDDAIPTVSVNDVAVTEGNAGTTTATFTVGLTGTTALTTTVDVATATGSAGPTDFDANTATLTFLPGETSHTFDVVVHGDTTFEGDEDYHVQLSNPAGALIAGGPGLGTITNDDGAPGLSIDDVSVTEGNVGTTPATFTVSLGNPSAFVASVDVSTQDGTATQPGDYDATTTTVTFQPGETSHTVDVPVHGDTVFEGNETFTIHLSNEVGASISVGTGHGTILDDEGALTLSVDDVTVREGNASATFTVSLSAVSATPVTVDYATHDGSAHQPEDYATTTGSLTFAPGETWKTVDVPVLSDESYESNETFTLDLADEVGAGILDGSGTATITDDDVPGLVAADAEVTEGDAGSTTTAHFTVHLESPLPTGASVGYTTRDGSATAGVDYTPVSGVITFASNEDFATIDVPVIGDDTPEADETFTVQLMGASGARLIRDSVTGTIVNDDLERTRLSLRAKGRNHHIVARGRMLHAEPGMRVQVVLLKQQGNGFVKIATEAVKVHIRNGGNPARTGVFTARFTHRAPGVYIVRANYRGDDTHLPAHARARVRL